jgi:hypothetical protein
MILHFNKNGFQKESVRIRSIGDFKGTVHFFDKPSKDIRFLYEELLTHMMQAQTDITVSLAQDKDGCYEITITSQKCNGVIATIDPDNTFDSLNDEEGRPISDIIFDADLKKANKELHSKSLEDETDDQHTEIEGSTAQD